MSDALLEPEEHVLSTLESDGSRRWLKPKLAKGTYLFWRRIVAYFLIAIFTLLPILKVGGKQAVFLNVAAREFTFFGFTFYPTDTLLLAIFLVGVIVSIFLFTSLFGRVWCGWACPQTVYLEFVFRPIERLFDGTAGRGGHPRKSPPPYLSFVRFALYFAICFYLCNTFLAYFVGFDQLFEWVQRSPIQHPVPFLIVATVTFFMMYDFCFFREQLCILACPYGRFQSVLLDDQSLIVSYDEKRGEPRGKLHKIGDTYTSAPETGDCIECKRCVVVCPTGIDIRDGLQMECVNCTQCIDACDEVMRKIDRPTGLIRYSSQSADSTGKQKFLRARVIVYPLVLAALFVAFLTVLFFKQGFTVTLLRATGNQYAVENGTTVRNQLRMRIINRGSTDKSFVLESLDPEVELLTDSESIDLAAGETGVVLFSAASDFENFRNGEKRFELQVSDGQGQVRVEPFTLLGPFRIQNPSKE